MLVKYLRDKKGRRCGCVVAKVEIVKTWDGVEYGETPSIVLGWSRCNLKEDKWDKNLALKIALGRLEKHALRSHRFLGCQIHKNILSHELTRMANRAEKYYKQYSWALGKKAPA